MNYRTTLLGALAGLSFLVGALAQEGPWTAPRILAVVAGVLVAALGAVARDAAVPAPPPALPSSQGSPPALPPSSSPPAP